MKACNTCRTEINESKHIKVTQVVNDWGVGPISHFCSMSCLEEWAYAERESQPKLSKSRLDNRTEIE